MLLAALALTIPTTFRYESSRWSRLAGDLSYGVYILHLFVSEVLLGIGGALDVSTGLGSWQKPVHLGLVLFVSLAASYAFEKLVQHPIDAWRCRRLYTGGEAGQPRAGA